jgi:hypothetical protein
VAAGWLRECAHPPAPASTMFVETLVVEFSHNPAVSYRS